MRLSDRLILQHSGTYRQSFVEPKTQRGIIVINNPLKYIDPSGHGFFSDLWEDIKDFGEDLWEGAKEIANDVWDWTKDNWQYVAGTAAIAVGAYYIAPYLMGSATASPVLFAGPGAAIELEKVIVIGGIAIPQEVAAGAAIVGGGALIASAVSAGGGDSSHGGRNTTTTPSRNDTINREMYPTSSNENSRNNIGSWVQRVFSGTEKGAGTGLGAKLKILSVGFEIEASNLRIDRLTRKGIRSFNQAKYALTVSAFGGTLGFDITNGKMAPLWDFKGFSIKNFTTLQFGGTIPHPGGAAVHGIVSINADEIW